MKKYRILALVLSAFVAMPSTSCMFLKLNSSDSSESASDEDNKKEKDNKEKDEDSDKDDDSSESNGEYPTIDIDSVKEHIAQLEEAAELPDNKDAVREAADMLLVDIDDGMDLVAALTLEFYTNWNDEDIEAAYDKCYEDYYVAHELAAQAFAKCSLIDEYSSMFEDYILYEDSLDYYTDKGMTMARLEGYTRVDYAVMDEYLDKYYNIAYDDDLDDDEKNLEVAKIYLDLLSTYDVETFYENYDRDFTPQEVIELNSVIQDELMQVSNELAMIFMDMPEYDEFFDDPVLFDNDFEVLAEYANKISPEIGEYADMLNDEGKFILAGGDDCYNGSFTITFPGRDYARVYVYENEDCYDFLTAVHEFGHYYASYFDDTSAYLSLNNIDIAEIQSQGMEMLFMKYYDELYGELSEEMQIFKLYDNIESILSGFLIGEFEYTILENCETMTPEEVVEAFDSMMSEYNPDFQLYEIPHIFEQPGYYISYGVSALAAVEIWKTSVEDYDAAVEMYTDIAHTKVNSGEYQFKSALANCGIQDVFNEDYIMEIGDVILDYAYSIY